MKIHKRFIFVTCGLLLIGGLSIDRAFAQDQSTADANNPQTGQSAQQIQVANPENGLGLNNWAFRPQAGALNFEGNSRMAAGAMFDVRFFRSDIVALGIEAGGLYSGLNNTLNGGSNFASGISAQNQTYVIQVPTEITFELFPDRFEHWRFGPSIGVDTIYSSSGLGSGFGSNTTVVDPSLGGGAVWNTHFAFGPEVAYKVNSNIEIGLRFDNVLMSAFNARTLTLSFGLVA